VGFFKKLKKKAKKISKRVVTGVATGGTSELLRLAPGGSSLVNVLESTFAPTSIGDLAVGASLATNPAGTIGAALSQTQPQGESGGAVVGNNFLGGISGLLGSASGFGGNVGTIASLGSGFLSGFLPAQGPVASQQISAPAFVQPTMGPAVRAGVGAITTAAGAALAKLSAFAGKNVTLRAAMIVIRRLAKILGTPTAVALALGLSVGELQTILTENALKGSSGRRMNPGNVKALRRAQRRIKSFHKLCVDSDSMKRTRRRSTPKAATTLVCK